MINIAHDLKEASLNIIIGTIIFNRKFITNILNIPKPPITKIINNTPDLKKTGFNKVIDIIILNRKLTIHILSN